MKLISLKKQGYIVCEHPKQDMICPNISKWTNKFPECAQLSFKLKYIFKNPVTSKKGKQKSLDTPSEKMNKH